MEEEHNELLSPPKFRYKLIKIATLTLLFLAIFFCLSFVGLETTSSSEFCASCHEMKPEVYTWKASTHSEVDCTNCHTDPVFKKIAKDKAQGVVEALKKQSLGTSAAPIRMPGEISDSACESCHDVLKREVTPSGDIIIPHDKHKTEGVKCVQCHSGVAHGKIADRQMTYKSDHSKWDSKVGTSAMADIKFILPDMDTCMECHKARNVTLECKACHTTGMVPKSHKKEDFKLKTHGPQAKDDLKDCNTCHKDMSEKELEGFEDVPTITKFLNKNKGLTQTEKTHFDYAKENTFCRDCHNIRPPSHSRHFLKEHGSDASENKEKCMACHEYQRSSNSSNSLEACGSCHPSSHSRSQNWRSRHPIQLYPNQKLTSTCYQCHFKQTCEACHKED